jgi:acetyl/propionyl-CoA carboxylase alpha subunit/acetyl-CoA carboxylase carboxyltransferase component
MPFRKLLIANRGEIAIRIARAAAELGIPTVAVYSTDDAASLHVRQADEAVALPGSGARAYLAISEVIAAARQTGCDALHPGYGFLSENPALAQACAEAGITFVGPGVQALQTFGDKVLAKALAAQCGVPLIAGSDGPVDVAGARAFLDQLGPGGALMIKAVAGGGGRGMRAVHRAEELEEAHARCRSEALAAFGRDEVYVERLIAQARHIEVQVLADAQGEVVHLWERECSAQRRHQKIVEIAPSPRLDAGLRERILQAAVRMARAAGYCNLGTFEFLVDDAVDPASEGAFVFIEANPRLQVEHTVTEAVLGVDLVQAQLQVAAGATLASLGLTQSEIPVPRGHALQMRINMETLDELGHTRPSGGVISVFAPPSGPGIRVDSFGYAGYRTSAAFDSLLAKLIVHSASPRFADALAKAQRALRELHIEGVATNTPFLEALLAHPDFSAARITTRFIDSHVGELVRAQSRAQAPRLHAAIPGGSAASAVAGRTGASNTSSGLSGATGASGGLGAQAAPATGPEGSEPVASPLQGTVVSLSIAIGERVRAGESIAVLEAMKMEHLVAAPQSGIVRAICCAPGVTLMEGEAIAFIEPVEGEDGAQVERVALDLDHIRPDLADLQAREAFLWDANRPKAVARRRATGQRTARENIAQLFDESSFTEYGSLSFAAQRARRSIQDLIENTPADGVIAGTGTINAEHFGPEASRALGIIYDYTVLAGTQGHMNHKKQDRMLQLAQRWRIPLVLYGEGGGGRPGDTEGLGLTGLDGPTFAQFARLSGLVPIVGVVSGYCFAGNAALIGCCDVIIATKNSSIGMGGPAMIEGGGLGVYAPQDVGPVSFMSPNGVIDVVVEDEKEATEVAKKYLGYFQGALKDWTCSDQRRLRHAIPENRLRVYDVREVIETLADDGSVLELRRDFGVGIVTALIRIEGRPMGLIANNPRHLGGAIDAPAGDKAARFMQLCDAFDLPVVSLCDTPGFMVGPEAEKTAVVRHVSRMFVVGASMTVPMFTLVLRKGYGLGSQGMAAGGFHEPVFTAAWPTGEFGGMGLEGYVRLGFRKEMEAIEDPAEREAYYQRKVAELYDKGKATSIASVLEIDAVIDPARTREWIMAGLRSVPQPPPLHQRTQRKRPCIDTW